MLMTRSNAVRRAASLPSFRLVRPRPRGRRNAGLQFQGAVDIGDPFHSAHQVIAVRRLVQPSAKSGFAWTISFTSCKAAEVAAIHGSRNFASSACPVWDRRSPTRSPRSCLEGAGLVGPSAGWHKGGIGTCAIPNHRAVQFRNKRKQTTRPAPSRTRSGDLVGDRPIPNWTS